MEILILIVALLVAWLAMAGLYKIAVTIVREEITFPAALLVAFCSSSPSLLGGLVGLGWIGIPVGWIVGMIALKKLSTVEDIWPTAVLIALIVQLLGTAAKWMLAAL